MVFAPPGSTAESPLVSNFGMMRGLYIIYEIVQGFDSENNLLIRRSKHHFDLQSTRPHPEPRRGLCQVQSPPPLSLFPELLSRHVLLARCHGAPVNLRRYNLQLRETETSQQMGFYTATHRNASQPVLTMRFARLTETSSSDSPG